MEKNVIVENRWFWGFLSYCVTTMASVLWISSSSASCRGTPLSLPSPFDYYGAHGDGKEKRRRKKEKRNRRELEIYIFFRNFPEYFFSCPFNSKRKQLRMACDIFNLPPHLTWRWYRALAGNPKVWLQRIPCTFWEDEPLANSFLPQKISRKWMCLGKGMKVKIDWHRMNI